MPTAYLMIWSSPPPALSSDRSSNTHRMHTATHKTCKTRSTHADMQQSATPMSQNESVLDCSRLSAGSALTRFLPSPLPRYWSQRGRPPTTFCPQPKVRMEADRQIRWPCCFSRSKVALRRDEDRNGEEQVICLRIAPRTQVSASLRATEGR